MPKPTIGRRVWFWPSAQMGTTDFAYRDRGQPLDAGIAYVWHDGMVNISVADQSGRMHSFTSVPLLAEGAPRPELGFYCEWMPYQKEQAAKLVGAATAAVPAVGNGESSVVSLRSVPSAKQLARPEFQVRVMAEKQELDDRIERLRFFIGGTEFVTLHPEDKDLLNEQYAVMAKLSRVLAERIARFD